jgi:F-type H+-transporting ATPase subunit gamma
VAKLTYIKKQIALIREIERITNTMKTISAVRLRIGRGSFEKARAFSEHLGRILGIIGPFKQTQKEKRLLVGIFPDRGLVGGFSDVLGQHVLRFLESGKPQETKVIVLGSQGKRVLRHLGEKIIATHPLPVHRVPHYRDVRDLTYTIFNMYKQGEFSQIFVSFMRYVSITQHYPLIEQLIPPPSPEKDVALLQERYLFLSDTKNLYQSLLFEYLAGKLYGSLAEGFMSEQATRFMLMDSATTHARETLETLSLLYAKKRQEKITQELNEVTGASEALRKFAWEERYG